MADLYRKHFMKQKMMERMLWALAPATLGSVWFFGLRSLLVIGVSVFFACFAEWIFVRKKGGKISEAALVTGLIFALSLPPKAPLWIVAVGILFGMVFGKMAFGGFGANLFNPAIVARAFVYISFSKPINADWTGVVNGALGGFSKFIGPDIQEYGRGFSLHEAYCRKYFRVNGRDKRSFDPYRGYLSYQDEIGRLEADGGNGDRVFRAFRDTEPAAARTGCESAVRGSLRFLSFHNGFHSHRTHFGTQNA